MNDLTGYYCQECKEYKDPEEVYKDEDADGIRCYCNKCNHQVNVE